MGRVKAPGQIIRSLAALALIVTLSSCGGGGTATSGSRDTASPETKPVKLKLVSSYNTSTPIIGSAALRFRDQLETASGGNLKVRVYEPDELVGALEVLDAVSAGKVEAGYTGAGFWLGKITAAPLFSAVPFGPDTNEYLAWFYYGNGLKLYQEMYDQAGFNVKVLILTMLPPETSGWFAREINSIEDLKGLKMRFYGYGGDVMEKLGVSVSVLPGGEIFPSLEKRVIDATEYSMPAIDENLQFYKLVKYNYYPGWHQQATALELLINGDVWDGLSPAQQALIEMTCRDGVVESIAVGEGSQPAVIKRNLEEHGVTNEVWPPEILEVFRKTWETVAAEQSAKDPFFKKAWEDLQAFRKDYRVWGKLSRLPADMKE